MNYGALSCFFKNLAADRAGSLLRAEWRFCWLVIGGAWQHGHLILGGQAECQPCKVSSGRESLQGMPCKKISLGCSQSGSFSATCSKTSKEWDGTCNYLHNEGVDVICAVWLFSQGQTRLFKWSVSCSHSANTWLKQKSHLEAQLRVKSCAEGKSGTI